jgi:hypothetical protein
MQSEENNLRFERVRNGMKALACFAQRAGTIEFSTVMKSQFSKSFTALVGLALASPTRLRQRILCRRSAGFFPGTAMRNIHVG